MCWRRILVQSNFQFKFQGGVLLACVAMWGGLAASANAQLLTPPGQPLAPTAKAAAQQFLNDFWDRGLDARKQAAERYETAPQDQVVVQFAYALNRAQQGKSREAIEVLQAINQRDPANLDAWLLKAWHLALTDQHDQTLTALGALAQQFSQAKQPLDPVGKKSLLQRMGRLVGYLEGPVKHTVNDNLLSVTIDRIEQNLDAASVNEFNAGRQHVAQVLQQLLVEQSQTAEERLKRVAAENRAEAERLKQENEQLEDSESRLAPQRESLVAAGNEEISNLEQQASSLLAQLNSVNADAYIVEQDLAYALADLNRFQRQDRRYRPSYHFRAHIDNLSYRLSVLRGNAFALSNQLATVRNQLIQTRQRYSAQVAGIDQQLRRTEVAQRRNSGRLSRLAGGPELSDGKASAMESKRESLRTYDDLSLELYRQDLLNAIK